ncbi:MAG: ThiF family adenylyltransferase [Motiliproteus sp.]|nr:ThiF family adenylyltransferase [Motiliproteus sp.]MCW9053300.1 ThiF family adenylyltransferase [Motiliproteus sp.]
MEIIRKMFNYNDAFSRNIGWVTDSEQECLKNARVAIAGAGGVGSVHALTLARLGIGNFNLADFDEFDVHNFNRQAGAFMSTVGRPKVQVMGAMVRDINPEADIKLFEEGVTAENLENFLAGVDIYVDSLDFFALEARKMLFAECEKQGIPIVTVAPLGMGAAMLVFMEGSMGFQEYFGFEGQSEEDQLISFLVGLSPSLPQRSYLVDPTRVDFHAQKGPSTGMAVQLCSGLAGTTVLKILLNRGEVVKAPRGLHFDAYKNSLSKTWRPLGSKNPIQWLARKVVKMKISGQG